MSTPNHSGYSCHLLNPRKKGRLCVQCENYFHLSCVKLSKMASIAISSWKCPSCSNAGQSPRPKPGYEVTPSSTLLESDCDPFLLLLAAFRMSRKIPQRIPKGSRAFAASCLRDLILGAISSRDPLPWVRLACFAPLGLGIPINSPKDASLSSQIKSNLLLLSDGDVLSLLENHSPCAFNPGKRRSRCEWLKNEVARKLSFGDIRGALRPVSREETISDLDLLRNKHPPPPPSVRPFAVCEEEVLKCIASFDGSSSAGIDGLRPSHLKDLVAAPVQEGGKSLTQSLVLLIEKLMCGDIPSFARDLVFCANLFSFSKKDGGIRPIAIGSVLRRLASKIACRKVSFRLSAEMSPIQLGVGVPNGCEAAVHATRGFLTNPSGFENQNVLAVKLDIKKAFNSLRRDCLLERLPLFK